MGGIICTLAYYKINHVSPGPRLRYTEGSFSFAPFFSYSLSFFFLFNCDTSVTSSSVSTSSFSVGGGHSFSCSLPLAGVEEGMEAGWFEETGEANVGSARGYWEASAKCSAKG